MVTLLQIRKRWLRKVKWLVCALNPVMQLRDSQSPRRGTDNWCRCVPSRRAPTCTSPILVYKKAALLLEAPHTTSRKIPSASYTSSLLYTCASNNEALSSGCQCCSERGKGCFSGPSQTVRKEVTGRCVRRKAQRTWDFSRAPLLSYPTPLIPAAFLGTQGTCVWPSPSTQSPIWKCRWGSDVPGFLLGKCRHIEYWEAEGLGQRTPCYATGFRG